MKLVPKSIIDITDILNEYSNNIQEEMKKAAESVAQKGADKLKSTSPKNIGKYAKGWKVRKQAGKGFVNCTIHNSTNWQLTHLLENPHIIKNKYGTYGTSTPQKHIKPVEQECIEEYTKEIENIIKNGG